MKPDYIESEQALKQLCDELLKQNMIAIDTEFFRETTYYPKLALVQIASDKHIACIDPLAFDVREQLARLLFDQRITKIFHACIQDLEVLYQYLGRLPCPVADTQIAAALLGEQDQIGYANLVYDRLGVQLGKTETRTNWLKRPLTEKQIQYALDDVRYLIPLYDKLVGELEHAQREAWFSTECSELCRSGKRFEPDMENCWKRVRGSNRASGRQLVIIDAVARWREQLAIEKDLTRRKVLADDSTIEIAFQQTITCESLRNISPLMEKLDPDEIDSLAKTINDATASDPATWPRNEQQRLTPEEKSLLKTVLEHLKTRAGHLGIAPNILCSRREAERLIKGERNLPVLQDWRLDIIGNELLSLTDA